MTISQLSTLNSQPFTISAMNNDASSAAKADPAQRRSFLVMLGTIVTAALITLFPFAAGFGVLLNPLRRKRDTASDTEPASAKFLPVCALEDLPADGIPLRFPVTAETNDAWTHATQRIGAVFLTRSDKDPSHIVCFSTTCPHLGCAVHFDPEHKQFECPCHKSGFAVDGQKLFGPALRGLDRLDVKLEDNSGTKKIWVDYERFQAGIAERKPIG